MRIERTGEGVLVVIGGAAPEDPFTCLTVERASLSVGAPISLAPGETAETGYRTQDIVLVLPGMEAQIRRLEGLAGTDAQARTAAALLFEGEGLHAAVGAPLDPSGARLAAAIAQERLSVWLARCASAGLTPGAVHLDCLLGADDQVLIIQLPDRAVISAGARGGFTLERDLAPAVAGPWLRQAGLETAPLRLVGAGGADFEKAGLAISTFPGDAVATLARAAASPPAASPNLLQGAFAPAARRPPALARWRFAAVLLVLAVLSQAAMLTVQGVRDADAANRTLAEAERAFRAARPEVKRIVNLRAQIRSAVNAASGAERHPVLAASAPLTEVLKAQPRARLEELRYEGAGQGVVVRLVGPDQAVLDAVTADLEARGLPLRRGAAQVRDGAINIDLTVAQPS